MLDVVMTENGKKSVTAFLVVSVDMPLGRLEAFAHAAQVIAKELTESCEVLPGGYAKTRAYDSEDPHARVWCAGVLEEVVRKIERAITEKREAGVIP